MFAGVISDYVFKSRRGPVATILVRTGTLKQGDAVVVGQVFEMNDRPHTVVGVMPQDFRFPHDVSDVDMYEVQSGAQMVYQDFDSAVAIHPTSAEELVTMKTPDAPGETHVDADEGIEWREAS